MPHNDTLMKKMKLLKPILPYVLFIFIYLLYICDHNHLVYRGKTLILIKL